MRYSKITTYDINNGLGFRVSVFFQGCPFRCNGCFNPETWDINGGFEYTEETRDQILDLCNSNHIAGLSILGGEPFIKENLEGLLDLVKIFKEKYPDKNIWIWTGYKLQDLIDFSDLTRNILSYLDYLVDGQFILSEKDLKLLFRGSSNQTIWENKDNIWTISELNNKHGS